jgi:DNA-binding MarR family transcriptional regulator
MDRDAIREFEILTAIGEGRPLTQRALSQRLGVALGLTNLYLKRVVRKGYVKISRVDRQRLGYLLTTRGLAELEALGVPRAKLVPLRPPANGAPRRHGEPA